MKHTDIILPVSGAEPGMAYRDGKRLGIIERIERGYHSRRDRTHVNFMVRFPKTRDLECFRHDVIATFESVL